MKKIIFIVTLLLVFSISYAQENVGQEEFPFYVDASSFPEISNNRTYTEVYFGLFGESLEFIKTDQGEKMAGFVITAEVYDDADSMVDNRKWINEVNEKNLTGSSTPLFHIGYMTLSPGKFKIRSTVTDIVSNKQRVINSVINVPDFFNEKKLKVSDLELAYRIDKAAEKNPFVKNGLMVVPNPTRIFTVGKNLLYVYFEVINLDYSENSNGTLSIKYEFEDNMGNIIKTYDQVVKKPGKSAIIYRPFNIATLKPGLYTINAHVTDDNSSESYSSNREFEVFRVQSVPRPSALNGGQITELTEEQSEMYKNFISAVGTENEVEIFKSLNAKDQISFIQNFWRKRDPDPDTPENEFRNEMLRRWNYVKRYDRNKVKGYRTHRGQVYLELGEADHIETLPNPGLRPHEIWNYYEMRIKIIFADLRGTGVYTIVSEERPDQTGNRDDNWQQRIRVDKAGIR
ncbi:GWxTD domain-containing protein [candidate division KSB1 bacterium]